MQQLQRAKCALAVCVTQERLAWGSALGRVWSVSLCSHSSVPGKCFFMWNSPFPATWPLGGLQKSYLHLCREAFTAGALQCFHSIAPPCPNLLQNHLPLKQGHKQVALLSPRLRRAPSVVWVLCEGLLKTHLNITEGYPMALQSINTVHNSIHFWGFLWII